MTTIDISPTRITAPEADVTTAPTAPQHMRASWVTVAVFAVVISYTNGFWLTSLQGAVGAIERNQPPLQRWLRDSTMMLPFFVLAVLGAIALARRWVRPSRPELVKVAVAGLLIFVICTGVSIAEVATSSVYDYKIQSQELAQIQHNHVTTVAAAPGTAIPSTIGGCTGLCAQRHATWRNQMRALKQASVVLLLSNLVLVPWVLALLGARLAKPKRTVARRRQAPAARTRQAPAERASLANAYHSP